MQPRVVGVPGTFCAPSVFRPLARELRGDAVVDAVGWLDGPGPWTLPDAAVALADRLDAAGGGPVLLAGHSTGGAIAVVLAARRPDLVRALLLADTGAHMRRHGDVDAIIERMATAWGPEIGRAVVQRSFATPPDDLEELLRYADTVRQRAALDALRSQRDLDLTPLLAGIDVPVAVVHGVHDRARSVAEARELAAALPHATLHLADTGHTPVAEDPVLVAAVVRDLLDATRPPTAS